MKARQILHRYEWKTKGTNAHPCRLGHANLSVCTQAFDVRRGQPGAAFGRCVAVLLHMGAQAVGDITALALSSDGQLLVSGASDGTVVAWQLSRYEKTPTTAALPCASNVGRAARKGGDSHTEVIVGRCQTGKLQRGFL